jgi:DNA-directed RNA polymerase subunit RPC12/RpoP
MSDMLDNPDEIGIYPTSQFMAKMEDYICDIIERQAEREETANKLLCDARTIIKDLHRQIKAKDELITELVASNPECCWRKCWGCGKKQIHRASVTPGVLCRYCGSQDTRLLKEETQALKGTE